MNRFKNITRTIILGCLICFGSPAQAHDTILVMDAYQTQKNTIPGYKVFSTHHFPAAAKDQVDQARLEEIFFISPSSTQMSKNSSLKETGTYVCMAVPQNGFSTKTPEGYQQGKNKTQVKDPVLCRNSFKFAKAVFSVGQAGGDAFSKPLGQNIEIIPLKDPGTLKTGDILPVKVLKEGKPARTFVYGTYDTFTDKQNTFAYTTSTDKEGIAEIKLIHKGAWLLIAKIEEPFPDTAVCDTQRWATTLTFYVDK